MKRGEPPWASLFKNPLPFEVVLVAKEGKGRVAKRRNCSCTTMVSALPTDSKILFRSEVSLWFVLSHILVFLGLANHISPPPIWSISPIHYNYRQWWWCSWWKMYWVGKLRPPPGDRSLTRVLGWPTHPPAWAPQALTPRNLTVTSLTIVLQLWGGGNLGIWRLAICIKCPCLPSKWVFRAKVAFFLLFHILIVYEGQTHLTP